MSISKNKVCLVPYSPSNSSIGSTCYMSPNHSDTIMAKMYQSYLTGQLTDVTLVAGEVSVKAHRIVLSSVTNYFSAMFNSNLREAHSDVITLKDVDGKALKALVSYAYTGQIDIKEDTVESILCAASLLGFSDVMEACSVFLLKQLDPSNCIGITAFADARSCTNLKNAAHNYTLEHFEEVIENQEFILLPYDEVIKLIQSDGLKVPNEIVIFEAVVKWINYDKNNRMPYIRDLLVHVRLPLIIPFYLIDQVSPFVGHEGKDLVIEALQYHVLPYRRVALPSIRMTPRKYNLEYLFAVAGTIAGPDLFKWGASLEHYSPVSNVWKQYGFMPGRRGRRCLQLAVASVNHKIYVAGGRDGLRTLNSVDCYDLANKSWNCISDMLTPRHGLGLVAIPPNGPLYAIGGHDGWSYLSTVERWDPETGKWTFVGSLLNPRSTVGVGLLNNKIYAVGGRDGMACLKSVEVYDPHTNRWAKCASMNKRRGGVAVAVLNGYLYALGGHDVPSSNPNIKRYACIERYNPQTNVWTLMANMSVARDGIGVAIFGNKILAAGGFNGESYLQLVELYDPCVNEWSKFPSMNVGRAGLFLAAVKLPGYQEP